MAIENNKNSVNTIKCLMIGQSGIGKTSFLKNFPNSQQAKRSEEIDNNRERFLISSINEKFEKINIEIDDCDIALDTCLRDSDLIINNKVIPSNKIINTCDYKVIIMSFAMDDLQSFELIKSKWEIELKKNKKKKHSFILIGLKSDTIMPSKSLIQNANPDLNDNNKKEDANSNPKKARMAYVKERSLSMNSFSSTSKFKLNNNKKRGRKHLDSETDNISSSPVMPPTSYYKKFAKSIGSSSFIEFSNMLDETSFSSSSNTKNNKLNAYEKLIKMIFKAMSSKTTNESGESSNSNSNSTISKSISAPIDFNSLLRNRFNFKSKTVNDNLNSQVVISEADNETYHFENETSVVVSNGVQNTNTNETTPAPNLLIETSNIKNNSVKTKLSRLFIGIGAYVVTCGGTHKSRKLAELRYMKKSNTEATNEQANADGNKNDNFNRANKNIAMLNRSFMTRKNKNKNTWLLLSSENSLNELDY